MKDTFLSIENESEGFYKEKGSKFIARAFYVETVEEIKSIQEKLRKEYYDARHHCYAYRLGVQGDVFRANDDGEPSNSAGMPILNQIKSAELTNILVVVIRYFGGTKLGVSGLIRAYKAATEDAFIEANIKEYILEKTLHFSFDYPEMNDVMKIIKQYDLKITRQEFTTSCEMSIRIREKQWDEVTTKIGKIENLSINN